MGAILTDYQNLPTNIQEALTRDKEGLTFYFSRPLSRIDRFIIDGIIVGAERILCRETDCKVVEYLDQGDSSLVRFQASRQEDLLLIAKLLHEDLQQPRRAAPPTDADTDVSEDGRFCLTLGFRGPLAPASHLLIEGVLSDPAKRLGRETDAEAELSLEGETPCLRLWASQKQDLKQLKALLVENLDELRPVDKMAMMPIFHALNPALYEQVHKVAQAVMPDKTELWVKDEESGKVEQQPLQALMHEFAQAHRTLLTAITEGNMTGNSNIQLGEGAVFVGGDASNLTGVGKGNTVVTMPANADLQKVAEGLGLLVAELQKQGATTTEALKLTLQLAEARDKAQAGDAEGTRQALAVVPPAGRATLRDIVVGASGSGLWSAVQAAAVTYILPMLGLA